MFVREVMSSPPFTVSPGTSVRAALRLLDEHNITALPVVDEHDHVVGVVSEVDLVRKVVPVDQRLHIIPVHPAGHAPATTVSQVMTRKAVTVSSRSDLADAVGLMTSTAVKSLPVVDEGQLVGVVSRRDVVHVLARKDESIRREVEDLVRDEGADWSVDVSDGLVRVSGPSSEQDRRVAEVLAGSVPGVVAVRIG
jgi:CBS domain-containing protein